MLRLARGSLFPPKYISVIHVILILLLSYDFPIAAEAANLTVCDSCYCELFPKTLEGRVVDVPASIGNGSDDWLLFNETIQQGQTAVILFRSVDPICTVEIKLKSITSNVQFLVYPNGRDDPSTAVDDLGPRGIICRSGGPDSVSLGASVLSKRQELGIAFIQSWILQTVAVDLQLWYRQHCPGMTYQIGLALPPPFMNGTVQKVRLVNPFSSGGILAPFRTFMVWSIVPPTSSCSLEITFTKSTNNTYISMNKLAPVLLGITHKVPTGMEATLRLGKAMVDRLGEAAVTIEYRLVDCGMPKSNGTTIQIASWNNVVKPLHRVDVPAGHDPWRMVNFTFPDDGAQQVSIWYMAGPETAYMTWSSWGNTWPNDLPDLYQHDFNAKFNSSIMPGSKPFVFRFQPFAPTSTSFRYAFLSISASPLLVAQAKNTTLHELRIIPEMVNARRLYIQASNASCAVEIQSLPSWGVSRNVRILPFGFNDSRLNNALDDAIDEYSRNGAERIGVALRPQPVRSVGPIMGIQFFADVDLVQSPLTALYRMVCPTLLGIGSTPNVWRYVSAPSKMSYILPQPSPRKDGKQCWLDISGVSTGSIIKRDGSLVLVVTCLQVPMRTIVLINRQSTANLDFNCTGPVHVDAYSGPSESGIPRNATLFAYRLKCEKGAADMLDGGLAPLLPLSKVFVADAKWKTFDTKEYEYEMDDNSMENHRQIWMVRAKSPDCHVEVYFHRTANLASVQFVEDYTADFRDLTYIVGGVNIRNLRYVSCSRNVFIAGLGKKDKCQYRQVCGGRNPGAQCAQDVTVVEPSLHTVEWQTLQVVSPGNLNQLQQLHYHIPFPGIVGNNNTHNVTGKVLELEFTSLIASESWSGFVDTYSGSESFQEVHGIWLNNKTMAIVGKQYMFKSSVTIKVNSLLRTKRGDHLFTVRYRMVDVKQARQDIRLGEVLTATSKAKTLEFKIPQQFSAKSLHQILKQKRFEYEDPYYGQPAGDFPIWFFRHQYTIRPSNASCQVMLKFTKMDIGSGSISGTSERYSQVQHRLSVELNGNGSRRVPLACSSVLDDFERPTKKSSFDRTVPICARMDHTYVSKPGSALTLLFRSTAVGEYEYDYESGSSPTHTFAGREVTFGSGWTATYQQICDSNKANLLATIPLKSITAKALHNPRDWQQNLPGQLNSDEYRLFRDRRWLILPEQVGCEVQYVVATKKKSKEPIPILFQVGNDVTRPFVNHVFTKSNVTILQLGTNPKIPIVIKYRQVCTMAPTISPTTPTIRGPVTPIPTAPKHAKPDGQTCTFDWECVSGICSTTLLRCTASTCTTQCASRSSSQSQCRSFAVIGCSCQWSSKTGSCVMVV